MHKQNDKFPATHFNFDSFLLTLLLKIVNLEKIFVEFAMKLGILLAFEIYRKSLSAHVRY